MCAMYRGTARDISFLIDFIPAYLFPEGERTVEKFAVTGVSLGGEFLRPALVEENLSLIILPSKATQHGSFYAMSLESPSGYQSSAALIITR